MSLLKCDLHFSNFHPPTTFSLQYAQGMGELDWREPRTIWPIGLGSPKCSAESNRGFKPGSQILDACLVQIAKQLCFIRLLWSAEGSGVVTMMPKVCPGS